MKIWSIRTRGGTHQVRWRVGPQPFAKSYATKTAADGRRSELMTARRNSERFDTRTGLPESELRAIQSPTWFAHARAYAAMKWPSASAKHRASIADALATISPKLVQDFRGAPRPEVLRAALYAWAFRFKLDERNTSIPRTEVEAPPAEITDALSWIERKSLLVRDLNTAVVLRQALDALALRLDGRPAAANTVHRKYTVFSNALRYAVECELLNAVPLSKVDWQMPDTDDEIDFRYVPGPRMAGRLLEATAEQGARGQHLRAFFGCLYYAAMRPAEATDLRKKDCTLPDDGWGELVLAGSTPRVGSGWTDSGASFDARGLKRRARKTTRPVPIPPVLVRMLREHVEQSGTAPDGRLFRAARGGHVLSKEYAEIWQDARRAVLTASEAASPLADVPYSLRHAGVSLWLNSGVAPTEVARRAGHSVAVLYRFYAKAIHGRQHLANEKIERALNEEDTGA